MTLQTIFQAPGGVEARVQRERCSSGGRTQSDLHDGARACGSVIMTGQAAGSVACWRHERPVLLLSLSQLPHVESWHFEVPDV